MTHSADKLPSRETIEQARDQLFSAVIGDVMDDHGLHNQFLPPRTRPLSEEMVVVGRAMPVVESDLDPNNPDDNQDKSLDRPFGLMFHALDDLKPGEVYLASGASPTYALWGGLMSHRAIKLGAAGAVLNGYSRDTREIRALGFPTFSFGGYAQDQRPRGRVVDFRLSINIEGVRIDPGDIVFGDLDGVCIIPRGSAEDVFRMALEKVSAEDLVRRKILEGVSSADAFSEFGVM